jgi:hypothetical protein
MRNYAGENLKSPVLSRPSLMRAGLAGAFSEYFQKAPMTIHQTSNFGERFLSFISEQPGEPEKSVGVVLGRDRILILAQEA